MSNPSLGHRAALALKSAKSHASAEGRTLSWAEVAAIIDGCNKPVRKSAPVPRKRNELLDALVGACGGDPNTTTRPGFQAAATALSDIQTVCPELTTEEIETRARAYKRLHPGWDLTPSALAKWWASLGAGDRTRTALADIYVEPPGWKPVLQRLYDLSESGIQDKQWLDLGPDTRREILTKMRK